MSKDNNLHDFLQDVADAIKEKKGTTEPINAQSFSEEIRNLPSGGEDDYSAKMMVEGDAFVPNQTESIVIGKNITKLGGNCFMNYTKLVSCLLPEGLTTIDYNAFSGCSSLKNITLPKTVKNVQNGIFKNCTSLESLTFPEDTASLGNTMFEGCTSLKKFVLLVNKVITLYSANSFLNTPIESGTGFIYVKDDLVAGFKAATNWSTYADQIKPLSELPNE